jgi:hypothetical protein
MPEPRLTVTPVDLFAFGNRSAPRPPRLSMDIVCDDQGVLPADFSAIPQGATLFADPQQGGLSGHFHRLPAGTILPRGLAVKADGCDVIGDSPLPPSHHTLHVIEQMTADEFSSKFVQLPWEYGGRR